MIACVSAAVSFVLVLSAARPGAECGSDLACTTRAHLEAARDASPDARAQHLLTAARSRLALFRGTGDEAQLCPARRHAAQAVRLPHQHLGDRPSSTVREIDAELKRLKIKCARSPRPASEAQGQAARPSQDADPTHDVAPQVDGTSEAPDGTLSTRGELPELLPMQGRSEREREPAEHTARTEGPAPEPVVVSPTPPVRPGRRTLIAGGVLLGSAALAGGAAVFAFAQVDAARARANALAADADAQGFTDPQTADSERDAGTGALRWQRVMVATAVASGVLGATAVGLLGAGARARRLARENFALQPTPIGLLLWARF